MARLSGEEAGVFEGKALHFINEGFQFTAFGGGELSLGVAGHQVIEALLGLIVNPGELWGGRGKGNEMLQINVQFFTHGSHERHAECLERFVAGQSINRLSVEMPSLRFESFVKLRHTHAPLD